MSSISTGLRSVDRATPSLQHRLKGPTVLTEQDVAFFRENGYLLPRRQLFSEEKLALL